jgi:hypothetical protein
VKAIEDKPDDPAPQDPQGDDGEEERPITPTPLAPLPVDHTKAASRSRSKQKGKKKAILGAVEEESEPEDENQPEEGAAKESSGAEDNRPIFERTRNRSKSASSKGKEKAEDPSSRKANTMQIIRRPAKFDIVDVLPPQRVYIDLSGDVSFSSTHRMLTITPTV